MISINLSSISFGMISLTLGEGNFSQKADTYYYGIDNQMNTDYNVVHKVLVNLKELILKWHDCLVVALDENWRIVYLPFDFADEYVGFLKVSLVSVNLVSVEYGYSEEIRGYSLNPSNTTCLNELSLKQYDSLSESYACSHTELIHDIKSIKLTIESVINTFE